MLTAHQRIAWARRWPGYTLTIEGALGRFFEIEAPNGDTARGVSIVSKWRTPHSQYDENSASRAARDLVELLNSA